MIINWTNEKTERVRKLIDNFINKHSISSGESLFQRDEPNTESVDVMSDIVDVLEPFTDGESVEKEDLFIDMDGVLCDFEKRIYQIYPNAINADEEEFKRIVDIAQATPGFYRSLPPMPGAIEAFKKLSTKYDVYILSAPSWADAHSYSEKREWVNDHLGDEYAYRKLILTHNKGHFRGKALIDDRTKYGVDKFGGEHIQFGTGRFKDWASVLEYLM